MIPNPLLTEGGSMRGFENGLIPFADLKLQYLNLHPQIDKAVKTCLQEGNFINGPEVKNFAQSLAEYLQVKHVIPCANGTDALQLALMALDLNEGDEIIIPAFTYVSPAEVAVLLKLKPVFVDVHPDTFMMDETQLQQLINNKTKAIIPVHLFGQIANMEAIMAIADANNLIVIEDNAQALGASYQFQNGGTKKAGTIGHIGCTSFFPTKNLGCFGDGGALFTNNETLAERIKTLSNHGQQSKYNYELIGINSRLDSIQAAILSVKLPYLDQTNQSRKEIASYYNDNLHNSAFAIPAEDKNSEHIFHQYTLKASSKAERDGLQSYLKARGISSMVYYPKSLHLQKAFEFLNYQPGDFPVSEKLNETVISIPVYPEITSDQMKYIANSVFHFNFAS